MTRISRTSRYAGFTLLEVILAVAVASMIAASLYAAMSTAFKARKSITLQLEIPRQAAILLDVVEQQLRSGIPATEDKPFVGYDNEVDFYTINRDPSQDDLPTGEGECWVALFFRDQNNSHELVQQTERNLLSQITEDPVETVLSRDVLDVSFEYYDGSEWATSWDSADESNQLPHAVRVTVEFDRPTTTNVLARYRMTRTIPLPWYAGASQSTSSSSSGGGS